MTRTKLLHHYYNQQRKEGKQADKYSTSKTKTTELNYFFFFDEQNLITELIEVRSHIN